MTDELERQLLEALRAQAEREERLAAVLINLEKRLAANDQTTVTIEQAMEILGCGRSKVFDLIKGGQLRKVKVGLHSHVTMDSIHSLQGVVPRRRST
ncbi:MAG: helix-turn-helix domain-containing protein [Deltaproteobacteria bacterium]|nr:helix-turn-helix domain-containing protein [Deltaproteobacteria bacterium]